MDDLARRLLQTVLYMFAGVLLVGCSINIGPGGTLQEDDAAKLTVVKPPIDPSTLNPNEPFKQDGKGKLAVPDGGTMAVYYPVPFTAPPNLQVESSFDSVELVSQHPDHFTVRRSSSWLAPGSIAFTWRAEGLPAVTAIKQTGFAEQK
jgi:hypothetical protein